MDMEVRSEAVTDVGTITKTDKGCEVGNEVMVGFEGQSRSNRERGLCCHQWDSC